MDETRLHHLTLEANDLSKHWTEGEELSPKNTGPCGIIIPYTTVKEQDSMLTIAIKFDQSVCEQILL